MKVCVIFPFVIFLLEFSPILSRCLFSCLVRPFDHLMWIPFLMILSSFPVNLVSFCPFASLALQTSFLVFCPALLLYSVNVFCPFLFLHCPLEVTSSQKKVASSIYCLTIHTMMWRVSCPENYHLKDDRLRLCFLFLESLFLISSERWDWDWRDKELTSLETKCIQYQEHEGICFFSRIRNFYLRFGEKRNQVEVVRVGLTFTHTPSKRLLLSSVSDFLSSRVHWFPYFSPTLLFFAKKSLFDAREVDDAQYTFSSCVTLTCFSSWVINPGFFVSRRKKISVSDKTKKEERRSETCVTEHTFRVKNR